MAAPLTAQTQRTADRTDDRRRGMLVVIGGVLCAFAYAYLASVSRGYADASLFDFYCAVLPCLVITFSLWGLEARGHIEFSWCQVLAFAILFRCIGVLGYPVLEDDHFRYLWDGWVFVEQGVVYGIAPAEFFGRPEAVPDGLGEVLDGINYPDVATVYGPIAQYVFGLSYLIAPGQVWPLQVMCALADIGIIMLLARMAPLRWVFLYAWSPLLIKEFSFTAHVDVIGAACLMVALWLAKVASASSGSGRVPSDRQGGRQLACALLVGMALAGAAGVKPFVLIAAPFILGASPARWASFALTCVLVALPFGIVEAWVPDGLQAMAENWYFNAPIYYLWLAVLPAQAAAASVAGLKLVLTLGFAAIWAVCAGRWLLNDLRGQAQSPPIYWLFGLLFLAMPVFNPWYMVWALIIATLRPTATAWMASAAVLLSYITGLNIDDSSLGNYGQPGWALLLEFALIAAALIYDWRRRLARANPIPRTRLRSP